MISDKTYISIGDFIDLFYKIRQKSYREIISKLHFLGKTRTVSKWNNNTSSSDFWIIPEIRRRWNEKCTGNPNLEYEDYIVHKYLSYSKCRKMLSVGCGTGSRERKFAKYSNFDLIEGIDLASKKIDAARNHASEMNLNKIKYFVGEFSTHKFQNGSYDIILFNSSLHHFKDVLNILQTKILPLLKDKGYLLIFEYVGPNRLQWIKQQLEFANKLLTELPVEYRIRFGCKSIKRRIYRPGLLRMLFVDPSEAIDSESILPSIHKCFKIIEEKKIGWDITHLVFKDIAHNFLNIDTETQELLSHIFKKEDEYLSTTGRSDAVFGIYQK